METTYYRNTRYVMTSLISYIPPSLSNI